MLIPAGFEVVVEKEAGYLFVERCQEAALQLAATHGATLHSEETVVDWKSNGTSVDVTTDKSKYSAGSLVLTAGAWTNQLLHQLNVPLRVIRKLMTWHKSSAWSQDSLAGGRVGDRVFYFELPDGEFYGVPTSDDELVKLAYHSGGMNVPNPLTLDRACHPADLKPLADFIRHHLPGVSADPVRHAVCMYTSTPDGHFVIDQHPEFDNVIVGAGFSGHGFKFASVLGSALADLSLNSRTDHAIDFLRLKRFE